MEKREEGVSFEFRCEKSGTLSNGSWQAAPLSRGLEQERESPECQENILWLWVNIQKKDEKLHFSGLEP